MKFPSRLLTLLLFLGSSSPLFAQSVQLKVSVGSYSPTSITHGQWLTINATVTNTGTAAAGFSHLAFYLATDPSQITQGYLLGETIVEPLVPGASSANKQLIMPLRSDITAGQYYIGWNTDDYSEVGGGSTWYLSSSKLVVTAGSQAGLHLPYPMILIHGLISNDLTWDNYEVLFAKLGMSFGGRFDFCLNADGSATSALASLDIKDFTNTASVNVGDYYLVNFDVDRNGTLYNNATSLQQSNASAAVKQGIALKSVIRTVLSVTKREKVILVGHSMGGLAAREYLQNPVNWVDAQHHIAKLLTLGTPHGGSDAWTFGVVDGYTEAVRDLRTSYSNGANGVYLFGGNERVLAGLGFYNMDVNCNGIVGDSIIGLNQKPMYINLALANIIGTAGFTGDGVVAADKANLNNYYKFTTPADTFMVVARHSPSSPPFFGQSLVEVSDVFMKGLDEPSNPSLAYRVNTDTTYFGFITPQSGGGTFDSDTYRLTVRQAGSLTVSILDIPISGISLRLYDINSNPVASASSSGQSQIAATTQVTPGDYYIGVSGYADAWSWRFPYGLLARITPASDVNETRSVPLAFKLEQNYPNPFNPSTTIQFELPVGSFVTLKVYSVLGEEVATLVDGFKPAGVHQATFDGSKLASGVYIYRLQTGQYIRSQKMLMLK